MPTRRAPLRAYQKTRGLWERDCSSFFGRNGRTERTRTYRIKRSCIISTAGCLNRNMLVRRYSHGLYRFGSRRFSTSIRRETKHYQFVVAGGGTGGLSIGSTFCRKFPKSTAIIEPSEVNWLNHICCRNLDRSILVWTCNSVSCILIFERIKLSILFDYLSDFYPLYVRANIHATCRFT